MKLNGMKKVVVLGICVAVAALVVPAYGGIATSAHDFSGTGWTDKICEPCHTPHNATTGLGAPLWNHEVTTQTFTLYDSSISSTFDATDVNQPTDSKLCLSCHDGTVALDSFGGDTGSTNISTTTIGAIGTDLSNMHPIGFTYDAALATADGGLFDPTLKLSGLSTSGMITDDMLGGTGNLGCAACHDVHNSANLAGLLRKDNAGSALCMTCHDK